MDAADTATLDAPLIQRQTLHEHEQTEQCKWNRGERATGRSLARECRKETHDEDLRVRHDGRQCNAE